MSDEMFRGQMKCMVMTKEFFVRIIRREGAGGILVDWKGTDEEAIEAIESAPYDYWPMGPCDNRLPNGDCGGHPCDAS